MSTISFKIPDALLALLENESRARHMNKSALVRAVLEREFSSAPPKTTPSCFDLAHDLAGSAKGMKKDIATNPKYMEGFGK